MNFYQFIIARLDGNTIESDFDRYLSLVKKGIVGFIIFGGEVDSLRDGIIRLQEAASLPLVISSDLEQGLGQQVKGGTVFPPATAIAIAERKSPGIARKAFECIAQEAAYVGINTIFAPVLDVNSNPANPIISTRAFSGDPDEVSSISNIMMETFRENGIVPCGKHFPGHGDTTVDSHLALPEIYKTLSELEACELKPFRAAVSAGVPMIMVGHLKVPALDPTDAPATVSAPVISFLKNELGFKGIVITDAMNMGGLGSYSETDAALMSLDAGVDILLHPSDPDSLALSLENCGREFDAKRVDDLRRTLGRTSTAGSKPPACDDTSRQATLASIVVEGNPVKLSNPFVLVLCDEEDDEAGAPFINALKQHYPDLGHQTLSESSSGVQTAVPDGADLVVAIYSKIRAFKGGTAPWIEEALKNIPGRVRAAVSFGNPYALTFLGTDIFMVLAWWDAEVSQLAAANKLLN